MTAELGWYYSNPISGSGVPADLGTPGSFSISNSGVFHDSYGFNYYYCGVNYSSPGTVVWSTVWTPVTSGDPAPEITQPLGVGAGPLRLFSNPSGYPPSYANPGILTLTATFNGVPILGRLEIAFDRNIYYGSGEYGNVAWQYIAPIEIVTGTIFDNQKSNVSGITASIASTGSTSVTQNKNTSTVVGAVTFGQLTGLQTKNFSSILGDTVSPLGVVSGTISVLQRPNKGISAGILSVIPDENCNECSVCEKPPEPFPIVNSTTQITTSSRPVGSNWVISAQIVAPAEIPLDIFIYQNLGSTEIGPYYGVASLDTYNRTRIWTGTPVPVFGNKFVRYSVANLQIDIFEDPNEKIKEIREDVTLFRLEYLAVKSASKITKV